MRNHQKGKNQLKDQDRQTGEQTQVGDQTVVLIHQEGPTGSILSATLSNGCLEIIQPRCTHLPAMVIHMWRRTSYLPTASRLFRGSINKNLRWVQCKMALKLNDAQEVRLEDWNSPFKLLQEDYRIFTNTLCLRMILKQFWTRIQLAKKTLQVLWMSLMLRSNWEQSLTCKPLKDSSSVKILKNHLVHLEHLHQKYSKEIKHSKLKLTCLNHQTSSNQWLQQMRRISMEKKQPRMLTSTQTATCFSLKSKERDKRRDQGLKEENKRKKNK